MCLSHEELPEKFTDAPFKADTYIHYLNGYHGSLLTLVTHETIVMDEEKHLRRKRDAFNG